MGEAKLKARQIDGLLDAHGDACARFETSITILDPDQPWRSVEDKVCAMTLLMVVAEITRVGEVEAARSGYAIYVRDGGAVLTVWLPRARASEVRADVLAGRRPQ